MEGMSLSKTKGLRVFCLAAKPKNFVGIIPPQIISEDFGQAKFFLGYSMDDIQQAIQERYGKYKDFYGGVIVDVLGSIPVLDLIKNINEEELVREISADLPIKATLFQIPIRETSKEQFLMNLMLCADRFADPEDVAPLKEILKRVKTKVLVSK